ncbi:hypothetical protein MKW92_050090, partial [Papaver armeniacum]
RHFVRVAATLLLPATAESLCSDLPDLLTAPNYRCPSLTPHQLIYTPQDKRIM